METGVGEAELDDARAWVAALVENAPMGVLVAERDGGVRWVNDRALTILGVDGEDRVRHGLRLPEGLQTGDFAGGEQLTVARLDGSTVTVDATTAAIRTGDGAVVGAVAFLQDLTQREQRERTEQAGREFVTNAAHQLQSPLAGILSAIEVLQSGAKDGPERDVFLGHIEREADRMARLVRALLTLARAQTGYEAPKDELVALEPLLSDVKAGLRPAPGVRVEVECPADLAVVTNRALVEQALMNVADNAAKYTAKGSITLGARPVDGGAEIFVSDTGPGIPQREQPHVMERFYRGSRHGPDGFGLGFAIVRSAIDAVHGELEVSERKGGGTLVTIGLGRGATLVEAE